MNIVLRVALAIVVLWIVFRLSFYIRKRVLRRRERRTPGVRCPECDSKHVDDFSDADSGMCLECRHVWGVKVPRRG